MVKTKKVVYISSPYSNNPKVNIIRARYYCAVAIELGYIPLAMHLLFPQFMSECYELNTLNVPTRALQMDLAVLVRCDEVWVCGELITNGMQTEIETAKKLGIKVRYFTKYMKER